MKIERSGDRTDLTFNHPLEAVEWLASQIKDKTGGRNMRNAAGSYGWDDREKADHGYHYNRKCSFNMREDWQGMQQLALTGWKVGTDDILCQVGQIEQVTQEELSGYRYDVTGQFFDVGLVVSGEPECWFEQEMEPTRKVVSICANLAASGDIGAEQLARKGAAIIALVDQLQSTGYIVELTALIGASGGDKTAFAWFEFGTTALDMDAAALAIAHAGFFRVVGFALIECANGGDPGQAYCKDLGSDERSKYSIYLPSGDLRNANGRDLQDTADAADWVKAQVAKVREMDL